MWKRAAEVNQRRPGEPKLGSPGADSGRGCRRGSGSLQQAAAAALSGCARTHPAPFSKAPAGVDNGHVNAACGAPASAARAALARATALPVEHVETLRAQGTS